MIELRVVCFFDHSLGHPSYIICRKAAEFIHHFLASTLEPQYKKLARIGRSLALKNEGFPSRSCAICKDMHIIHARDHVLTNTGFLMQRLRQRIRVSETWSRVQRREKKEKRKERKNMAALAHLIRQKRSDVASEFRQPSSPRGRRETHYRHAAIRS